MHSGFLPVGVHLGSLVGGALQGAGVQSDLALQNHISHSGGGPFVQANPQLPLSQAQCEQFLNFLKCHMAIGSGNDAQTGHQAIAVMTSHPSIPHSLPFTSSSPSTSSKFSSNSLWIPPNLSHSIFAAQVVDRQAYKSNTWIIDTGTTDHMVDSVAQLTSITSIVHTFVYLPNGEQALVTHIGTVHISSSLILTNVLCMPSFTFHLISVSQLTKSLCCCLIFLGDCCFIQDFAQWSTIGLGKAHNGLFLLQDSAYRASASVFAATVSSISSSALRATRYLILLPILFIFQETLFFMNTFSLILSPHNLPLPT